jgi:peroxiredoxin
MRTLVRSLSLAASLLVSVAAAEPQPGAPAPAFTLTDIDGKAMSLADAKGKVVVLEWFNPSCPFVQRSHTKGSLAGMAKQQTADGVVWLAINSGAPGREGTGVEVNRAAQKEYGLPHTILLDESGTVGKEYGATNTPNMFVIDAKGTLVYRGAIDNSPDAIGQSPEGGTLVNYVEQALEDVAAGRAVRTPSTKPYGCSVKYGS